MWLLRTLIFMWNILLSADGSYSLITRVIQLTGGGTMSVLMLGLPLPSPVLRVLILVTIFILFIMVTDKLVCLFKNQASARILRGISKSKQTKRVLATLQGIDDELYKTAKRLSNSELATDISDKNACGLLELLGVQTKNILADADRVATRRDVIRLVLPIATKLSVWYSLRKKDYLLELAILMDSNKAGLGRYDEMTSQLKKWLQFVSGSAISNAYDFLKWSYGINSLLLLSSRDLHKSTASLTTRVRVKIQKLLYDRDQIMQIMLVGTIVKIGLIKGD